MSLWARQEQCWCDSTASVYSAARGPNARSSASEDQGVHNPLLFCPGRTAGFTGTSVFVPCHFTNCIMQADFKCLKSNHSNCRAFKLAEGKGIPSLVKTLQSSRLQRCSEIQIPLCCTLASLPGFQRGYGALQVALRADIPAERIHPSTHGHSCRRSSDCVCKDGAVSMCACLSARPGMHALMRLLLCSWKASCGYLTWGYDSSCILRGAGSKPWAGFLCLVGEGLWFCS